MYTHVHVSKMLMLTLKLLELPTTTTGKRQLLFQHTALHRCSTVSCRTLVRMSMAIKMKKTHSVA
jgi:hypothetical protein